MSVPEGYAYDFVGRVALFCISCGATIHDDKAHTRWHNELVGVLTELAKEK